MGVVLLVEHIELGQRMAVKVMTPSANQEPQALARFLREARSAGALQSEHVVRIFDVGTLESGAPYMVMELLRGEDLAQVLLNRGRLDVHDAVDYVLQACHAIAEAHAMGIVHRDLKPSNLFLTQRSDGTPLVKVLDFGISKATDASGSGPYSGNLTATSAVMGSPLYMSPEQVRDSKSVDARADVWSLGVILHELLTGLPAFQADTLPGICAAIIADDPPPLRMLRPDAPAELEAVITRCLAKSALQRFQTTRELMHALRNFASSSMRLNLASMPIAQTMKEAGISSRNPAPSSKGATPRSGQTPSRQTPSRRTPSRRGEEMTRAAASEPALGTGSLATSAVVASAKDDSAKPARSRALFALSAAGVAAIAVVALTLGMNREHKQDQPPSTSAAPLATSPRKSFVLVIDSNPGGAEVREGDRVLGTTPLQLTIDNEAVRADPRKLVVVHDGYQRYSILQGASDDNVRIIASLEPTPAETPPPPIASAKAAPVAAVPAHAAKPPKPAPVPEQPSPPPAPPPPPPSPPPGDIRLKR
jgi:serine/threonine-protein kinase